VIIETVALTLQVWLDAKKSVSSQLRGQLPFAWTFMVENYCLMLLFSVTKNPPNIGLVLEFARREISDMQLNYF